LSKAHAEVGDYKGWPVITVFTGRTYRNEPEYVTLGLHKARAVDDCIDAIRVFVDHQSNIGMPKPNGGEDVPL
jgi:hypothetical protein